ncbi:MAG: hypothetical protein AAB793_01460, partial [Patescibacteria group bacterium]
VGITSVPVCGAGSKLTGNLAGLPECAPDIDTDTDAQTLLIAGSNLSISGGNTVALPIAAVDTLDTVTINGSTTGNSVSVGGLQVNGTIKITGGNPGAGKVLTSNSVGSATWNGPITGSCSIKFHKSYSCTLTVNGTNDYAISCSGGEDHGECRGVWSGLAFNQQCSSWDSGNGGWKVGYFNNTYVMEASGKQNNNKSPGWCARSCQPGASVDISGQESCGIETIIWP